MTSAPTPSVDAAHAALYARLPALDCRRECAHACGPIVATEVEWARIASATGGPTWGDDTVCPHLDRDAALCRAHALRPLICRLWGVVETMPCPHGCEPERWLSAAEADALIDEVIALAGGHLASGWYGWRQAIANAPDAPPNRDAPEPVA
jgi:hypothetical protein